MKRFPRQALALLGCACIVSAAAVSAQPDQAPPPGHRMQGRGQDGRGMGGPGPQDHMMDDHGPQGHEQGAPLLHGVKLDEAQQDKVFAIFHAEAPMLRDLGKAARQAHEALRAMSTAAPFDDAKAAALAQTGAKAMAAMALQRARSEAQIYALLTPEQRRQVTEHAARRAGIREAVLTGVRHHVHNPAGQSVLLRNRRVQCGPDCAAACAWAAVAPDAAGTIRLR